MYQPRCFLTALVSAVLLLTVPPRAEAQRQPLPPKE